MDKTTIGNAKVLLKEGKTPKEIMEGYIFGEYADNKHYNVDEFVAIQKVQTNDLARVKAEIESKMQGTYELTAKVAAEMDEKGEVTKEEVVATYYKVTTKTVLLEGLKSDEWEVSEILDEAMDGKTWDEFTKLY